MWLVLLFGGLALVLGGALLLRPTAARFTMLRGLSVATAFAVLSGLAANVAATCKYASTVPDAERSMTVLVGLAESLAPAILGFTVLALAWLAAAIGTRKLA